MKNYFKTIESSVILYSKYRIGLCKMLKSAKLMKVLKYSVSREKSGRLGYI